eukprot:scaffold205231_cov18-Tisochrysis_lutea.AAC.1
MSGLAVLVHPAQPAASTQTAPNPAPLHFLQPDNGPSYTPLPPSSPGPHSDVSPPAHPPQSQTATLPNAAHDAPHAQLKAPASAAPTAPRAPQPAISALVHGEVQAKMLECFYLQSHKPMGLMGHQLKNKIICLFNAYELALPILAQPFLRAVESVMDGLPEGKAKLIRKACRFEASPGDVLHVNRVRGDNT